MHMHRFCDAVSQYQRCTYISGAMIAAINLSQQLVIASTVAAALYVTCRAVLRGDMDVGGK
jgi:ABC-type transport system involved in Fe-S cluster assembly fused permease/ATPase subunit